MQRMFRNQNPYKTRSAQGPFIEGNDRSANLGAAMGNITGNWLQDLTKKHLSGIADRKESSTIAQSLMALMPEDKAIAVANAPRAIRPFLLKNILSGMSDENAESNQFFSNISEQQQPPMQESQEQAVPEEKAPDITKDPAFIELNNYYQSALKENKLNNQDKKAFNNFFSNPNKSSYNALLKHTKKSDQSLPDDPASISKYITKTLNAGKKLPKNINKILSSRGYDKKMIDLMKARELTPKIVDYFLFHSDNDKTKARAMAKKYGFSL